MRKYLRKFDAMSRMEQHIERLELQLKIEQEKTRRVEAVLKIATAQARVANAQTRKLKTKVRLLETKRDTDSDKEFHKLAAGLVSSSAGAQESSRTRKKVRAAPQAPAPPPEPELAAEPAEPGEPAAPVQEPGSELDEAEMEVMLDREFGRTAE